MVLTHQSSYVKNISFL